MKRHIAYLSLAFVVGCAQRTTPVTVPESTSEPEVSVGEAVQPTIVQPTISPVVVAPVVSPQPASIPAKPKPEAKPKPKSEPKPKPVVTQTHDGKLIIGSEEWVWLPQPNQYIKAKVELGNKLSRLGVSDLQYFERDGGDWVRFKTGGKKVELPVDRWLGQKDSDSRQAVVKLRVRLGELNELTDVGLTSGNKMVLGENFIRDVAVVDMKRKFVQPKAK